MRLRRVLFSRKKRQKTALKCKFRKKCFSRQCKTSLPQSFGWLARSCGIHRKLEALRQHGILAVIATHGNLSLFLTDCKKLAINQKQACSVMIVIIMALTACFHRLQNQQGIKSPNKRKCCLTTILNSRCLERYA